MSLSPDVADLAAAERAEAARRAFSRAESRGRVKTLTVVNLIGLMFAVIGAIGETNAASFMFPQIWGFRTPVGAVIGVLVVIALLTVAGVKATRAADREDRRYRFYASLTVSSSIMFAFFPTAMLLLYVFFLTAAA